ncbi:MAG: hypothetical protein ACI9SB_001218 [Candidatus Azotimanducaceae bacterium]|jgi:hypothetical protein
MNNKLSKLGFAVLVLSAAAAPSTASSAETNNILTSQMTSHAVISGGALSVTAQSVVDGNLAALEAVTIGAGLNAQAQDIYAGAAVTTGALSTVNNIYAGAAASIGASANAQNVDAGAAITLGASANVLKLNAGAAITVGASALHRGVSNWITEPADGDIHTRDKMVDAIASIKLAQTALATLTPPNAAWSGITLDEHPLLSTIGGDHVFYPGVHYGSALSIDAGSRISFDMPVDHCDPSPVPTEHVWVINLTEALTIGANTQMEVPADTCHAEDTYAIIWNVGAAITLGAESTFVGTAFVDGAFSAATSDVLCGNIYASGPVSIRNIGSLSLSQSGPTTDLPPKSDLPASCATNANAVDSFVVEDYLK